MARVVAYIWYNNRNINLEQVKRGYAWAYTEYLDRPYASDFYEAEKQVRKQRLRLWQASKSNTAVGVEKKEQVKEQIKYNIKNMRTKLLKMQNKRKN